MHPLPPLNALRAFEAAARHLSLTRASQELHVTPAAVSQQVKVLEDWLGTELFRRSPRGLSLSDAGRDYLPEVSEALRRIGRATASLISAGRPTLTVAAMSSFVGKWLVPRLATFTAAHPDVELHVVAANHLVDVELEDVSERLLDLSARPADIVIRYGTGKWPGVDSELLGTDDAYPVCAPAVGARLRVPADLAGERLLHDVLPEKWSTWLDSAGASAVDANAGITFSHSRDMLDAAALGLGVALGHGVLVAGDCAAGHLVRPFAHAIAGTYGYYLVRAAHAADNPTCEAFARWIRSGFAADQSSAR
jgi:LysR family transcriptional regulator, glycine cleavage system transcriptional activator